MAKKVAKHIDEQIKDLESEIAVAEGREPETPVEETLEEPTPVVEVKVEPVVEQPKPDDAAAKANFELREAKRKMKELEDALAAAQAPKPAPQNVEPPAPDRHEDPIGWMMWNQERLEKQLAESEKWRQGVVQETAQERALNSQIRELDAAERQAKAEYPDIEQAGQHVFKEMMGAAKKVAFGATDEQIGKFVSDQILAFAQQAKARGENPAVALYKAAKEQYGYATPEVEPPKPVGKPSLAVIESNKRKSANGLGTGASKGGSGITIEEFSKLSVAEQAKYSDEEINNLLAGKA